MTLFPPKAAPGELRPPSTYYPTTVGQVIDADPSLVDAIAADLSRLDGHSLGLIVNEPKPQPADWQPNTGNGANWGASNAHIGPCWWLFSECDREGFGLAEQLALAVRVFGAEPTFTVATGGKSGHNYARLTAPVDPSRFRELQELLIATYQLLEPDCKVDGSLSKPCQVMLLAGGAHPRTGVLASIHTARANTFDPDELEARLRGILPPLPPAPPQHHRAPRRPSLRAHRGRDYRPTLRDIADALATYPRRVGGQGTYAGAPGGQGDRNLLWGLVKACEEAGGLIETAIALMEAHSPSATCGWNVRQVACSGGDQATPGWFWAQVGGHPAKRRGVL
jgi:hypothetical protein